MTMDDEPDQPRKPSLLWKAIFVIVTIAIVSNVFVGIFLWANAV